MFFNLLQHLLALDLAWFMDLTLGNPIWVFFFVCAVYFMTDARSPKAIVWAIISLTFYLYLIVDLTNFLGWNLGPGPLMPVYIFLFLVVGGTLTNNFKFMGRFSKLVVSVFVYAALTFGNLVGWLI
jgi:hypothetical protein